MDTQCLRTMFSPSTPPTQYFCQDNIHPSLKYTELDADDVLLPVVSAAVVMCSVAPVCFVLGLTFESLDPENSFFGMWVSSKYLGHFRISRSPDQGQDHRSKTIELNQMHTFEGGPHSVEKRSCPYSLWQIGTYTVLREKILIFCI